MTHAGNATDAQAIEAAYGLFIDLMGVDEWERRRVPVLDYVRQVYRPSESYQQARRLTDEGSRISYDHDPMVWYLLLAKALLEQAPEYDYSQGARILPIFKRLGEDIELLQQIGGVDVKLQKLVARNEHYPDGVLFELLVALAYKRNEWSLVEFLSEDSSARTPDIKVSNGERDWFIECKRML